MDVPMRRQAPASGWARLLRSLRRGLPGTGGPPGAD
jgi:hypothetical protein